VTDASGTHLERHGELVDFIWGTGPRRLGKKPCNFRFFDTRLT
jgi:hypothetical protein